MPIHMRMRFGDVASARTFAARFNGDKAILKIDDDHYVINNDDVQLTIHIYGGEVIQCYEV